MENNDVDSISTPAAPPPSPVIEPTITPIKKLPVWRIVIAVIISLIFGLINGIVGYYSGLFIGLFAMGCGGGSPNCSESIFPLLMFAAPFVPSIVYFFILVFVLPFRKRFLIVWVIIVWFMGFPVARIYSDYDYKRVEKGANAIAKQMYEPHDDAQKFHPRITFINYTTETNPETETIVAVNTKIRFTTSRSGTIDVEGSLHENSNGGGYPVANGAQVVEVKAGTPTEVTLRFTNDPSSSEVINWNNVKTLKIFMIYKAKANEYGPRALLDFNPIFDIKDAGGSKTEVLPISSPNDREVYYKISFP